MSDRWDLVSVLCVDDEPGSAESIASSLIRPDGRISTSTATGTREGLDLLDEYTFHCIVSGHDMPGMDGFDFLETVRAEDPHLPFVLFTDRGSEEIASDAISADVTDYLRKEPGTDQYPVLAQRVRDAISEHFVDIRTRGRQRQDSTRGVSPDATVRSADGGVAFADPPAVEPYDPGPEADQPGRTDGGAVHPGHRDELDRRVQQVESGGVPGECSRRTLLAPGGNEASADVPDPSPKEGDGNDRERYGPAFERAVDAMVIADDEGRYIDANRSACDLFGVEKSELLGRTIEEFGPEDYDFDAPWRRFETTETERGTFPLVRPDGECRTVEYAATANIAPGEHLSVLRDVSERERRERVLKEMHGVISDRDRPFTEKVEALLALGRTELDTAYGTLSGIQGEDYVFEVVDADDDRIRAGDVVPVAATNCEIAASTERTLVLGDVARDAPEETDRTGYTEWGIACYLGAPVFVDESVYGTFCFYDTEPRTGQFSEWEVTLVDLLSRWVSYELQRQEATERLHTQNEKLNRFASIVSHDLRNPLNVLQGTLELAEESGDAEHFEQCHAAIERMDSLIDDLLALALAGETIDETGPVNLASRAEDGWGTVETKRATLQVETTNTVLADGSRLQQLLENLVRNAVEHGGEAVTITIGDRSDGFYVADDGEGIPEDDREDLFDYGYTTAPDGTGFGLAIVEEIADAHDWEIHVTEGSDGGARFDVTNVTFPDT